jgi:hypothetical protein
VAISRNPEGVCQLVVLKTVAEGHARDGNALQRLVNEARLCARMNHPNVVRIHGVDREQGLPVIVMEYLAGQSLTSLLTCANEMPDFSLDLRLAIVARLLRGLDYIHHLRDFDGRPLRVIHGGIAPDNVVITYNGEVKLIDFGFASVRVPTPKNQPDRSRLPYVAPERLSGPPDLRGDVFAAGVILWEMVAGRSLWGRMPAPTVVRRLLAGEIPRLSDAVPTIDPELDRICSRALARQPDERYRSAGDMRGDLERYLGTRNAFISDAAVGALLSLACREHRREAQKLIDARLSDFGLSLTPDERQHKPAAVGWRSALETRQGRMAALVLGASLLFASMLLWIALMRGTSPAAKADGSETSPSRPETERLVLSAKPAPAIELESGSAVTRLVRVEMNVRPNHAALFVDGQRLSSNPFNADMVWDPHLHTLRGEAEGFEGWVTTFRLDSDVKIDTELRPTLSGAIRRSDGRPDEAADARGAARAGARLRQ